VGRFDSERSAARLVVNNQQCGSQQIIEGVPERCSPGLAFTFNASHHVIIECHCGSDTHYAPSLATEAFKSRIVRVRIAKNTESKQDKESKQNKRASTERTQVLLMASRKAIVVGNDAEVRALLGRILAPTQWTIQDVPNNTAALKLVAGSKYDLIITCEKTSGREDVELLRAIRRMQPHTRVIILTDHTTPEDVISALREHAFGYFSAPFPLASLALSVQYALEEPCWDDGIEILSATPEWIRLSVRCEMRTAERLMQFFREIIDLPTAESETVAAAIRELLMNAIEHGGKFDPEKHVEVSYLRTRRAVTCRIKDPGKGFSWEAIPHAAVMNPPDDPLRHLTYREAENLRPGGFGVLLVMKSIDEGRAFLGRRRGE
jgi:DNA-binding NarL/FixJ family response regulator